MDTAIKSAEAQARSAPLPQAEESVGVEAFRAIDRMREALTGQTTGGVSPAAIALALFDWSIHLAAAPGKRMELVYKAGRKTNRLLSYLAAAATHPDMPPCIEPLPGDHRFNAEGWRNQPYSFWAQTFLLNQQWWHNVTHEVPGVTPHHEEVISFIVRQMLDVFSPSNVPFANPEVIERTIESGGANFVQGFQNWLEDVSRVTTGRAPVGTENFVVGRDVAVTPGKVVYRNHLIELIQYAPTTETVVAEPVLDRAGLDHEVLHPRSVAARIRSSVTWLARATPCSAYPGATQARRTAISRWTTTGERVSWPRSTRSAPSCRTGRSMPPATALAERSYRLPPAPWRAPTTTRLASVTLLAAQTDFIEPGELALFIDHSQMHFLESMMWNKGYLSADQMAGAFQLLRTNDLIWSRHVHDYLMGERTPMSDLMAWNADSTRMPYQMHAEYLQRLYLDNELAAGRFMVDGRPAAIQNIRAPMFVVATERDHVAPWRSVYKIHYLSDTDVTFVLTSGGHNAGIVSEPGHPRRRFRIALRRATDPCLGPEEWAVAATPKDGSWWLDWVAWLAEHSAAKRLPPPAMGAAKKGYVAISDAPGAYACQR